MVTLTDCIGMFWHPSISNCDNQTLKGKTTLSLHNNAHDELYDAYETLFDPMKTDRQARRKRKPKAKHTPKKTLSEVVDLIADTEGLEGGFETTYKPGQYEAEWLHSSLRTFYDQQIIIDVLAQVKGGKEASVYRCQAHPSTGLDLIAAKVYRPRKFRSLSNDAMYREGREILKSDGKGLQGEKDQRILRAVGKKTAFGEQVSHTSWLMHEFTTLDRLYKLGAPVPQPFAAGENAIMMTYHGDEQVAAPTLNRVKLPYDEAVGLFDTVMGSVELMLQEGFIHGDLSAYNILYWDGEITLIDFPQVVNSHNNSAARMILRRDIERVCEYFRSQGVDEAVCDPAALLADLWGRYGDASAEKRIADDILFMSEDDYD